MASNGKPPFRADHVGSMLRPKSVLDAREKLRCGEITAEALREIENTAIAQLVRLQEAAGLQSITDGEIRRAYFHIDFLEHLKGVVVRGGMPVKFRNAPASGNSRRRAWRSSAGSNVCARLPSRTSRS